MSFPKSNMKMFLLNIEILPQNEGMDLPHKLQKLDSYLSDYKTQTRSGETRAVTRIVYKFKVTGESKILSVIQVANIIGLERSLAGLSRLGGIKIECEPIMNFEHFARSIQVCDQLTKLNTGSLCKEGLYWLQFDIEYNDTSENELYQMLMHTLEYGLSVNMAGMPGVNYGAGDRRGKTTDDFIAVWKKEAETILTARHKEGTSVELYKVVAQRKAHVFINATDAEQVDFLSLKLPLMQENGANVRITCKALQFLEEYSTRIYSATEFV